MRILILDGHSLADSLSRVLIREGHDVSVAADACHGAQRWGAKLIGYDPTFTDVLIGKWDLVIAPGAKANRSGAVEKLRARGIPVIGGGQSGFRTEEKHIGRKIFEEAGLPQPHWVHCADRQEAIGMVTSFSGGVVVKHCQADLPFRTMMCGDWSEAMTWIERMPEGEIVLEDPIEGIEFGATVWYNGKDVGFSVLKFEYKYMFDHDGGIVTPQTGCLQFNGPSSRVLNTFHSILNTQASQSFLGSYKGPLSINFFLHEGEIIPVEFTARMGVPDFDVTLALHDRGGVGTFLYALASGGYCTTPLCRPDMVVGVVLSVCGYPYNLLNRNVCFFGSPVRGYEGTDDVVLSGVRDEGDNIVTDDGFVAVVTGTGATLQAARLAAYRRAEEVTFQDKVYRQDIGMDFIRNRDQLIEAGIVSKGRFE